MNYTRLFKELHEYAMKEPRLDLAQFKDICKLFWSNMSPTEQDLFVDKYQKCISQQTIQNSLKYIIRKLNKQNNP